jgi:hypothetical protein
MKNKNVIFTSLSLFFFGLFLILGSSQVNAENPPTGIMQPKFRTTVGETIQGEYSPRNFREISVLTSRIMLHVMETSRAAEAEDLTKAKRELSQAKSLIQIVRSLLPTVQSTVTIKNNAGDVVYNDARNVQDDLIPIFDGATADRIIHPLMEMKRGMLAADGTRINDPNLTNMTVWVDLKLVEHKVRAAERLLDRKNTRDAATQLRTAQSDGVSLIQTENHTSLIRAVEALALAERLIEQGLTAAAKDNLLIARTELQYYQSTRRSSGEAREIADLARRINILTQEIGKPGSIESVRNVSGEILGWFKLNARRGQALDTRS